MAIKPIHILINAKDNASKVFGGVQAKIAGLATAILSFASIKAFSGAVDSAEKLDVQMRKLEAIIASTGGAAGLTAKEIDEMARRLDEATLGSAEGFRDAAGQLLTFKSIGKDAFETTLLLAQDLADAGFGNLSTNAKQLGKALEDPVKGMSQLAESGVTFSKEQQGVIKVLVETGQAAKAQQVILKAVEGQVGGTAAAMGGGLSGAIDLVGKRFTDLKEQLGAAVLPVFTRFNTAISDLYKRLTDSGVVKSFGEAVAKALGAAVTAFEQFVSKVDFEAVIGHFKNFGAEAQQIFEKIGIYATNTGNSVQLAYGVMAAGTNGVLVGIYALGTAFGATASAIVKGAAIASEALAKIAITDGAKKKLLDDATAMREVLAGLDGVTVEFAAKANQSMEGVARAAQTAREGWAGLTASVDDSAAATTKASSAFGQMAISLDAYLDKAVKATEAQTEQRAAAEATTAAMAKLKAEYADLIAKGDLQAAVEKLAEINAELRKTPADAKGAEEAALAVALAFKEMGIKTKADLETAAMSAEKNFDLIKESGQATAQGLADAFKNYAESAIAANGGVATDALKSKAAMYGLEVASDSAGKAIVRAMGSGADAAGGLTSGIEEATQAVQEHIGWLERLQKRNAEVKSSLQMDANGFATDKSGNTINAGGDLTTLTGIAAFLKSAGIEDDATARKIALEFSDGKGGIPYFSNPGQQKYGGEFDTISAALLKAAEQITFAGTSIGGAPKTDQTSIPAQSARNVTFNLKINDRDFGDVPTDDRGSGNMQSFLEALQRGKGTFQ